LLEPVLQQGGQVLIGGPERGWGPAGCQHMSPTTTTHWSCTSVAFRLPQEDFFPSHLLIPGGTGLLCAKEVFFLQKQVGTSATFLLSESLLMLAVSVQWWNQAPSAWSRRSNRGGQPRVGDKASVRSPQSVCRDKIWSASMYSGHCMPFFSLPP